MIVQPVPDRTSASPPPAMTPRARFLAACESRPVDRTPVWFMRQAGSALASYRELRDRHGVAGIAHDADLAGQVAALPVSELGVDAAILFADIMLMLEPMGVELELTREGPRLARPFRTEEDVRRLRPIDPEAVLGFVLRSIRGLRGELGERAAIIGLAGGPFTLAGYLVEGGPSRDMVHTRAWMHAQPEVFGRLLERLAEAVNVYLAAQLAAGADAVQLFDSWVGVLPAADYRRHVAPWTRRALDQLDGPAIHFATGSGHLLAELAAAGGQVLGVDERVDLSDALATLAPGHAVQGNLDPSRILAGWGPTETGARAVLDAVGGRPGHIFNLGHAVPMGSDSAVLRDLAALVHEASGEQGANA